MSNQDPLSRRLERYLEVYRGEFRRRDQARWAAVFLQGLLLAEGRRNIENLARAVTLPEGMRAEDVAQALQHFINQSPWEEGKLWRRSQERLAGRPGHEQGVFVLEEVACVKQGNHSVGVHRQFSRTLGRKMNCQVSVLLLHVGPTGLVPLALRLYLPRPWLRDIDRLDSAGVPEASRQPCSKLTLGLELLDAARLAGVRATALVAGPGWEVTKEMEDLAAARGLSSLADVPQPWVDTLEQGRRQLRDGLGLEHFEGRSWRGFHHHACLVTLAHGYLSESQVGR